LNYISIDSGQVQTLDSNSLELPQSLNHILDFAISIFLDLKNPKCDLGSGATSNCLNQVSGPALSLWRCNST